MASPDALNESEGVLSPQTARATHSRRAMTSCSYGAPVSWLPEGFSPPHRVELPTGHHLRPIREADVDLDYPAVMGSRERLWAKYGEEWRWPPATMTYEEDKQDLARHERENAAHQAFNYAIFDRAESTLLGCVYIDPPDEHSPSGSDAVVSWWVVDDAVGSDLELTLTEFVPRWVTRTWGFEHPAYTP
jgi:hypothetical protein